MSSVRARPSSLHLTVPCPASLQLQEQVELVPSTREQAEGTGAHSVALAYARGAGQHWPLGRKFKVEHHDFEVDDDMIDGAMLYSDEAHASGRFEEPVSIPDIPECAGTPDYWRCILDTALRMLKVIDYKYGHRYVEVFRHWQLIAYAAGVARFLKLPLDFPIKLVIVQPRSYTHGVVREWETTVGEIYQICAEQIAPRVALALGPNPPAFTGRHCLDCRARDRCKTLQETGASIVDFVGTAEATDMQPEAIGQELRILKESIKRLEARYAGLYERASHIARAGGRVHHWGMQPGQGRQIWKEDVTQARIIAIGELFGVSLAREAKAITPTQAKQKGLDEKVIEAYAHRPGGAMRLVEDDLTPFRKILGAYQRNASERSNPAAAGNAAQPPPPVSNGT